MIPDWLDHFYVVGVLLLIMPACGWIAYQRFLKRRKQLGGHALVQEYRLTILWQLSMAGLALLIWKAEGRPYIALLSIPPIIPSGAGFAAALATGLGIGLFTRPILTLASKRVARTFARQMEPLAPFLPRTMEQLVWGLLVSLIAGVCEELVYRGYLMAYLGHWLGSVGTIIVTAWIFGIAHLYQSIKGVLLAGLIGTALGLTYLLSGTLIIPIALHAALDVSAMLTAWIILRERS